MEKDGSAYGHTTNALCRTFFVGEDPSLVIVRFSRVFLPSKLTRACAACFIPGRIPIYDPTAFGSERDRQPSAKQTTSGIARIAILSNIKASPHPRRFSTPVPCFHCTTFSTLHSDAFYYTFYCTYFPRYSRESAAPLGVVPPLPFTTTSDHVGSPLYARSPCCITRR